MKARVTMDLSEYERMKENDKALTRALLQAEENLKLLHKIDLETLAAYADEIRSNQSRLAARAAIMNGTL